LLLLSAVLIYLFSVPLFLRTKCAAGAVMFARKAEPLIDWQSVQWQMVSAVGSTSAPKEISPQ
jgi:hypothetical protein